MSPNNSVGLTQDTDQKVGFDKLKKSTVWTILKHIYTHFDII